MRSDGYAVSLGTGDAVLFSLNLNTRRSLVRYFNSFSGICCFFKLGCYVTADLKKVMILLLNVAVIVVSFVPR